MAVPLHTPEAAAAWLRARVPAPGLLRADSRLVQPGDGFLAWPGHTGDGRQHLPAARGAGAVACLIEAEGAALYVDAAGLGTDPGTDPSADPLATLPGLKAAAGRVASAYFGHPSHELTMVASTGTNGKTSTAWWTAQALTALGRRCGVVGTLGIGQPPAAGGAPADLHSTGLTTPDVVTLHAALRRWADAGFAACALEASSIGICEHRLAGTRIDVALFTNFTRDHLDVHGSMAAYWAAKRALFDWPGLRAAVINIDDAQGAGLAAEMSGTAMDVWTVSLRGAAAGLPGSAPARLQAEDLHHTAAGLAFTLVEGHQRAAVASRLVGDFNASNLLVVLGGLRALGVPLAAAAAAAAQVTPVPGRLQRVATDDTPTGPEVVVDYAHTPDALDKVLHALRPLASARGGRLWCVFGCGGNRDVSKRPLMGAIAAALADHVVVTSDNPRHEDPAAILAHIVAGIAPAAAAQLIEDRRVAIRHAVAGAAVADVVLLAGKGHEDYQDIAGTRRPFSDVDEARQALRLRAAQAHADGHADGHAKGQPA